MQIGGEPLESKKRIYLLDEIRGLAIILVVIYHFFYSAAMVFGFEWAKTILTPLMPWQPLLPITFVLLSGIAFNLSRNNLKRGIRLFVIGMLITAVTAIFMPDQIIWFGIIHFFGLANIICSPLKKYILKIPTVLGVILFFLLFVVTYNVQSHYLGILPDFAVRLPDFLYSTDLTMMFGFYTQNFHSSDYNPIFPWIFMFVAGILLGKHVFKLPNALCREHIKPLAFTGRHTLIIYIVHQPIILGILYVIQFFLG